MRLAIVTLVAACLVPLALAQPHPAAARRVAAGPGPSWQALTPAQRSALAPLQSDWASIDAPRRAKWIEIAGRYQKMTPDEQKLMQARMTEWSRLSPKDRARARLTFQQVKQLPQDERRDRWQAYQALSESQRQELAARAKQSGTRRNGTAKPSPQPGAKHNIVANPSLAPNRSRAVAPTVVQAAPGATTTLVTRRANPPAHQQAGLPKIAGAPGFVDRNTLLPRRGPQGAAVRAAGPAPIERP
ncbi:MAG: DUF3106 domain-containing protein [Ideonella sp.]|nr:DUF3106 domain-containing protein [Ideonella sp.]MCC7457996.1 DUF3106 domain-containing protein [Nitrospira sp.]